MNGIDFLWLNQKWQKEPGYHKKGIFGVSVVQHEDESLGSQNPKFTFGIQCEPNIDSRFVREIMLKAQKRLPKVNSRQPFLVLTILISIKLKLIN